MLHALKNKLLASCFTHGDNSIAPNIGKTAYDLTKIVNNEQLYKWVHDVNATKIALTFIDNPQEIIENIKSLTSVSEVQEVFANYDVPISKTLVQQLKYNFSIYKNISMFEK